MSTDIIIFEQPLNEHIRLLLRLEHLFAQVNYHSQSESAWDSRVVLSALLEILSVIDRPDLKNKLGTALNQYSAALSQLEKLPNVDKQKLTQTLHKLDSIADNFHSNQGKIGYSLRENEFLNAIQQRLYIPGGTCGFSTPAYYLWLHQTPEKRKKLLAEWLDQFSQLQTIVELMLKITRDSGSFKNIIAQNAFYQTNLDPNTPFQLIRIKLPIAHYLYPEISVGRHRLTIHFFEINPNGRASQAKADVQFDLAYCRV